MGHTYHEIQNQPRSWRETVMQAGDQWRRMAEDMPIGSDTHFLFIGSGTSLYIAQSAAQSLQEITGHVAAAVPASEIFLSPGSTVPRGVPVVAFVISRSGSTSEALKAADHLLTHHAENVQVMGITCNSGTQLAGRVRHTIELPHATEISVVMTQSYTNMLLALQIVAALIAEHATLLNQLARLPDLLEAELPGYESFARDIGNNLELDQFIYLGLGPNYGLAQEATLKLKEMTQTPCEAYNPLEFRHGPISIVRRGTAVVLLEGEREREYVSAVETDVRRYGAYVAAVAPYATGNADTAILLPSALADVARCVLYLPPVQLIAYYRAHALGLDPDQPRNLTQVVVLSGG